MDLSSTEEEKFEKSLRLLRNELQHTITSFKIYTASCETDSEYSEDLNSQLTVQRKRKFSQIMYGEGKTNRKQVLHKEELQSVEKHNDEEPFQKQPRVSVVLDGTQISQKHFDIKLASDCDDHLEQTSRHTHDAEIVDAQLERQIRIISESRSSSDVEEYKSRRVVRTQSKYNRLPLKGRAVLKRNSNLHNELFKRRRPMSSNAAVQATPKEKGTITSNHLFQECSFLTFDYNLQNLFKEELINKEYNSSDTKDDTDTTSLSDVGCNYSKKSVQSKLFKRKVYTKNSAMQTVVKNELSPSDHSPPLTFDTAAQTFLLEKSPNILQNLLRKVSNTKRTILKQDTREKQSQVQTLYNKQGTNVQSLVMEELSDTRFWDCQHGENFNGDLTEGWETSETDCVSNQSQRVSFGGVTYINSSKASQFRSINDAFNRTIDAERESHVLSNTIAFYDSQVVSQKTSNVSYDVKGNSNHVRQLFFKDTEVLTDEASNPSTKESSVLGDRVDQPVHESKESFSEQPKKEVSASSKENYIALNHINLQDRSKITKKRRNSKQPEQCNVTAVLKNQTSSVDYVLVHLADSQFSEKIQYFTGNLRRCGLHLQQEPISPYSSIIFIKIRASRAVLLRIAKVHNIQLSVPRPAKEECSSWFVYMTKLHSSSLFSGVKNQEPSQDIISADRILIINKVLQTTRFGIGIEEYGAQEMLRRKILVAAYPVHDSEWQCHDDEMDFSDRQLLQLLWLNSWSLYMKQPIQLIQKYFGPEIGFYFAWFGCYTQMLVPAAVFGLLSCLFGFGAFNSAYTLRIKEVCEGNNTIICPLCDHYDFCSYSLLNDSCTYAKLNYVFDNTATAFFAVFSIFWAPVCTVLWKKCDNVLRITWNLLSVPEEYIRPQYQCHYKTGNKQKGRDISNYILSICTVMLLLAIMILAAFGTALCRITLTSLYSDTKNVTYLENTGQISTTSTGRLYASAISSTITAVAILGFSYVFTGIVKWLTNKENPRTQSDFDRSYILKLVVLELANNYSVALYLAFFRGLFYTYPGDKASWAVAFGVNAYICDPSGCVADLCVLLLIMMLIKAFVNLCSNILLPMAMKRLRNIEMILSSSSPQWEVDYRLVPVGDKFLIKLYVDGVVQYGLVVFFMAGCPLLPLVALLNNIIQMHSTAIKLVRNTRRPVPRKVPGLGVWMDIIKVLTFVGTTINAFIIAFTTDIIPRFIYQYHSRSGLAGYVNSTLSKFTTESYSLNVGHHLTPTYDSCFYYGKRYPPEDVLHKYQLNKAYYLELSMKFATMLLIKHIVVVSTIVLYNVVTKLPTYFRAKTESTMEA